MKKIPSLFERDFSNRPALAYNEVTPGCEWVLRGEGSASIKHDGTACAVIDGVLYKRHDIRPTKSARRRLRRRKIDVYAPADFKQAPAGAVLCNDAPDVTTGHWPCWIPVGDEPESHRHRDGWENSGPLPDGTYELVGPKIDKNAEKQDQHVLWAHGKDAVYPPQRTFAGLRDWLAHMAIEGIVFLHPDGRMCKIKRRDFGLPWPVE